MVDEKEQKDISIEETQTSATTERPAVTQHLVPRHYRIFLEEFCEDGVHKRFPLVRGRTVIGRLACDLTFEDPLLSRKHAAVEVYNEDYVLVRDLASTNGTFVNDHLVTQVRITPGDVIRVGKVRLRLSVEREQDGNSKAGGTGSACGEAPVADKQDV